ncbi:MAG: NAD(+) synthase [Planctomycetota bacterium]
MSATAPAVFGPAVLDIDCAATVESLTAWLRVQVGRGLRRRGVVLGVSGGVDSAVCAALAARALGPQRVLALLMPERDSPADDTARGLRVCATYGLAHVVEDLTPMLVALGCYVRRDAAIRELFPEYGPGWRSKITLAEGLLDDDRLSFFNLTVAAPDGAQMRQRMPLPVYLAVTAATNMKQRTRKLLEYHHAERLNYAVVGTPNRLEYELGFFVRGGDGLADVKPIAHLYKTQVFALARWLGVPDEICSRAPDTGTYSLPQSQSEFFFGLPITQLDLLLYAWEHKVPAEAAGAALGLTPEQIQRVYRDIAAKRRVARQLHQAALVMSAGAVFAGGGSDDDVARTGCDNTDAAV